MVCKALPSILRKLREARDLIDASGPDIRFEVDGGVKVANIRADADAGADVVVSGSRIFKTPDYRRTIAAMRTELASADPALNRAVSLAS